MAKQAMEAHILRWSVLQAHASFSSEVLSRDTFVFLHKSIPKQQQVWI